VQIGLRTVQARLDQLQLWHARPRLHRDRREFAACVNDSFAYVRMELESLPSCDALTSAMVGRAQKTEARRAERPGGTRASAGVSLAPARSMASDKMLPHFLRFARALTLGSGLAFSGSLAASCDPTSGLAPSPDAVADAAGDAHLPSGVLIMPDAAAADSKMPFPGILVMPDAAADSKMPPPGVKPAPVDAAADGQMPFPGVKVMPTDAADGHMPFPGVLVIPDGGADDPIPSGGPLAAPDFIA